MVRTFKERFLRFQLSFLDFYHFHHVIWGMKWAKKLKTKHGQHMLSGPFSHDAAQLLLSHTCSKSEDNFFNWAQLFKARVS